MRLALDTNRYVDLCKGVEGTARLVSTAEAVFLPFVVVAELRAGFAFGKRTAEKERVLLQHNLRLHDRDRHFDHLPQIVRV